jgi:hypothetical protein
MAYERGKTNDVCVQLHRAALLAAADKFKGNMAELGRALGVKNRQNVKEWQVRGKIPAQYLLPVADLSGFDLRALTECCTRKEYEYQSSQSTSSTQSKSSQIVDSSES